METADDASLDLDRFFELSLDHLVVAGFDGYFKRLSRSWVATFGWSFEELYARPNIEFVHPDDRAATLSARDGLMNDIPLKHLVNRYLCKDGSFRWMEWRSIGSPENRRVYCVARDITAQVAARDEKERVQARLVIAERMAMVGRLAGGVAHEINNPLAYVTTNVRVTLDELRRLRQQGTSIDPDLDLSLDDALEGARRIKAIVQALQIFSRAEEDPRTTIELRPVLELTLAMLAKDLRNRARVVEAYGEAPAVNADAARLGQVFMNLLTNALQAIDPGTPGAHEIRVATSGDGRGRAVVEIRDTGRGIPASLLPRVFEPFFTTRPPTEGAGLGLWVCHAIISALNGEITLESEEGHGTTVRVVLPAGAVD